MTILEGEEQIGFRAIDYVASIGAISRQILIHSSVGNSVTPKVSCEDVIHAESGVEL